MLSINMKFYIVCKTKNLAHIKKHAWDLAFALHESPSFLTSYYLNIFCPFFTLLTLSVILTYFKVVCFLGKSLLYISNK